MATSSLLSIPFAGPATKRNNRVLPSTKDMSAVINDMRECIAERDAGKGGVKMEIYFTEGRVK